MASAPLAVLGFACRFPGADDAAGFWNNVLGDVYSIAPMPRERFARERYFDREIGAYGKSYCDLGGLVTERPFDAEAFRIPPRTLRQTDVAQLWALEVARSAFESCPKFSYAGSNTGVIIGHARGSMLGPNLSFSVGAEALAAKLSDVAPDVRARAVETIHQRYPSRDEDSGVGTIASALASRIASFFQLTGRAMVVDAACASSFAALQVAQHALEQGKLDAALVGGASYSQELSVVLFAQSRALSPDGSFPFDRRANGFISSDGFGFLVVVRLEDALRQGLPIRAVIRGIGASCDGKGKALWAPRKEGQVLAIRRAYERSGIDPSSVDLIEAHATSTPIGDATEIAALSEVFGRRDKKLVIGSVKGNIGHAREAAGAAGLIKAILALEAETLPPTGNFREPSPEIPWADVSIEVSTSARPWRASGPRRAGVDAFGIGGLNYHVLVEEAPPKRQVASLGLAETPPRRRPRPEPIAIVGMGGRFPEASGVAPFWEALLRAEDLFIDVPNDRWDSSIYHQRGDRTAYRTYARRGAFVRGFEADWRRYRVPPKLITQNDPLQFMLLESALDALEQAEIDPQQIDRKRVGTVMGTVFGSDYALELSTAIRAVELAEVVAGELGRAGDTREIARLTDQMRQFLPTINEDSSGSFSSSTLASRIAKTLDLMGPTFTLDAACASSLLSLEVAVELLRGGEADLLLFGGGDRAMRVQRYEAYCQFYAISRSDTARPFDHRADGFVPGEAAGVCALKRLDDARRDGNPILAVIRGVGSASDGERKSLHKPSARGLAAAMERALEDAGLDRRAVGFVECHGGATPVGDAAEVEALRKVYGGGRASPLWIGSVKSNVGHTQGAAGVVALIKAAQVLSTGQLPATRGFESPHPKLEFSDLLAVNGETVRFGAPAVAVSSMGLGGINAHVVLEAADAALDRIEPADDTASTAAPSAETAAPALGGWVFRFAAPHLDGLVEQLERFPDRGAADGGPLVLSAVLETPEQARTAATWLRRTNAKLETRGLLAKKGLFVRSGPLAPASVALMFSGQGSQYAGMFAPLVEQIPACRAVLDSLDVRCRRRGLPPLSAIIHGGAPIPDDVFWVQAAVLAGDLIGFRALEQLGIRPAAVTGFSFGDYAALVAAEVWTLDDAFTATALRAEAITAAVLPGGMLSVLAERHRIDPVLSELSGAVFASNLNAPKQTVLSGTLAGLEQAELAFAAKGIETRRLAVPRPFHSPLMSGATAALAAGLAAVPLRAPKIPYLSSVSGRFEQDPEAIRQSLVEQLTRPVDFIGQTERLLEFGINTFIESGPRAVLTGLVHQIVEGRRLALDVLPVDDAERPGRFALERIIAMLKLRDMEAAVALAAAPETTLVLFEGEEAERLNQDPSFREFWARTAPAIRHLVESLYAAHQPSLLPTPDPVDDAADDAPLAPAAAPVAIDRDEVQAFLIGALCEQTGYPPDIIDLEADLEADLGVDTVKQAQVLGKVRDRYQLRTDEKLSLSDFPTLRKVLDYVLRALETRGAEPVLPRAAVPTVDVTARRTERPRPATHQPQRSWTGTPAPRAPELTLAPALERPGSRGREPRSTSIGQNRNADAQDDEPRREAIKDPPRHVAASFAAPGAPRPAPPRTATATSSGALGLHAAPAEPPPVMTRRGEGAYGKKPVEHGYARFGESIRRARRGEIEPLPGGEVVLLELEGSAREIGLQHARALREPILALMDRYQKFLGVDRFSSLSLIEATRAMRARFDDDSLAELGGIADGVGLPLEYLLAYNLDAALFPALRGGCTQAYLRRGERDFHLVNEDSPLFLHLSGRLTRVVQIRRRTDVRGPVRKTVFFSLIGQMAGVNAVREDGFSITSCTLLDGAAEPLALPRGIPHPLLVKRLAEEATDLADARARLGTLERSGRWSLLLSDADTRRATYVEYDHERILCEREAGDTFVATNHAVGAPPSTIPEHSHNRRERALSLASVEPFDLRSAKALLRDRYDLSRRRTVPHPTMHTIRRIDNVMSLVIEPQHRRFHVTDHVGGGPEANGFLTIDYGPGTRSRMRPTSSEPVRIATDLHPEGPGLKPVDEVMTRYAVRLLAEDARPAVRHFAPKRVLLVGRGETALALKDTFEARGAAVTIAERAADAATLPLEQFETVGFVLTARKGERPWRVDFAEAREEAASGPFELLQAYVRVRNTGTVFGVTVMGGGLGFENSVQGSPEGGALLGLLKALRREYADLTVQALDVSPSATPEQTASALFAELDAGCPRLEVGLMRRRRMRLALTPIQAEPRAEPLPARWIITGGARGVTAVVATRLAELSRPELHLVGRTARRPELRGFDETSLRAEKERALLDLKRKPTFAPREWQEACERIDRAVEIEQNLARIEATGARVHYHAVDVSNAEAVASLVRTIAAEGPIDGLLHGAGVEVAKPFPKKTEALFDATVGSKADGLIHLLRALEGQPLSHVLTFSSVSGRFGGLGQCDYSLANELAVRILIAFREEFPNVRATVLSWPAWAEVGLAARESSRAVLEHAGQAFMPPDEGANHLVRELWAGCPEPEVVFCEDLASLDLDRLLPSPEARQTMSAATTTRRPLLDRLILVEDGFWVAERTIDPAEPFLDQHRIGPTPILPAVVGLEMMLELLALAGSDDTVGDVRIETPLKLSHGAVTVRVSLRGDRLEVTASARRPGGLVLEPDRLHISGRRLPKQALPLGRAPEPRGEPVIYQYPATFDRSLGSRTMFHGPVFRCMEGVYAHGAGQGSAKLCVPPVEALVAGTRASDFQSPAALLDGCLQSAGLLGRMLHNVTALPVGFGRLDLSPRAVHAAGETIWLSLAVEREGAQHLVSQIVAYAADGPLLAIQDYRAQVVPGA